MNYEAKRIKILVLLAKAEDMSEWYKASLMRRIVARARRAAKVDTRHANGILDRLLKSKFCAYLIEQEENEKNE